MKKFKNKKQLNESTEMVEIVKNENTIETSKTKKQRKPKLSIFTSTLWLSLITAVVVASTIFAVKFFGFTENRITDLKKLWSNVTGKITISYSADDFKYAKADEVSDQLHQMGFKKIKIEPYKKTKIGLFVNDNTIDHIQIKGNRDFDKNTVFDNNDKIVIYTYSLSNNYKTNRAIALFCAIGLTISLSSVVVLLVRKEKLKSVLLLIISVLFASGFFFASTNEKFVVGEVLYNTKIVVYSEKNMLWSKYPIGAMIDDDVVIEKIDNGATSSTVQELSGGKHTITFFNSEDIKNSTSNVITVDENATYTFKITKEKDKMEIANGRPAIQHGIVEDAEENISEEPTDNITQATVDPTFESDTLTSQAQ